MPSSTSRSRVPVRRSPRPAPRATNAVSRERPVAVPFAVVFGCLLIVEVLYLGFLLWEPDPRVDRFLLVPLLLATAAAVGSFMVLQGRRWGWAVLAVAAVLPGVALLGLAFLLGAFGAGGPMWAALLLLVGPLATLVLALRRPVRGWCATDRARRPAGGRRGGGSSR